MSKSARKAGYQEIRGKLSFFGVAWRIVFALWHVATVAWLIASTAAVAPPEGQISDGAALAVGISWIGTFFIWAIGSIILVIPVLLTRRSRALVPVEGSSP